MKLCACGAPIRANADQCPSCAAAHGMRFAARVRAEKVCEICHSKFQGPSSTCCAACERIRLEIKARRGLRGKTLPAPMPADPIADGAPRCRWCQRIKRNPMAVGCCEWHRQLVSLHNKGITKSSAILSRRL